MPDRNALEQSLAAMETAYRLRLVRALRECAGGRWGLFGHCGHRAVRDGLPESVRDLVAEAAPIDAVRERLGLGPFPLHARFLAARGPVDANAPGEPRQARAWLARMETGEEG